MDVNTTTYPAHRILIEVTMDTPHAMNVTSGAIMVITRYTAFHERVVERDQLGSE